MKTKSQKFIVMGSKILLAVLCTLLVFAIFASHASAQTQAQYIERSVDFMFTCSISDEDSTIVFKSNTARGCVGQLIRRSTNLGKNGKPVTCLIETPIASFAFKKQNDEPSKGRVQCIVDIQESAREFDVPEIVPEIPKPPKLNQDHKPAKLRYD
jgi:hypothetical protein